MKRTVNILLMIALLLCFSSCNNSIQNNSGNKDIIYTNLVDEEIQTEIKEELLNARIPKEDVAIVIVWVNEYNSVDSNAPSHSYTVLDGITEYNRHSFSDKTWREINGDSKDFYCRALAYQLTKKIIAVDKPIPLKDSRHYYLTTKYIAANDIASEINSQWTANEILDYFNLFDLVEYQKDDSIQVRFEGVVAQWKEREITFQSADYSLITLWSEIEGELPDENYLFSSHAGVLIETPSGLLFFEKTNPYYPYQATRFNSRDELVEYLKNTLIEENDYYGEETGILFVMENDSLLG